MSTKIQRQEPQYRNTATRQDYLNLVSVQESNRVNFFTYLKYESMKEEELCLSLKTLKSIDHIYSWMVQLNKYDKCLRNKYKAVKHIMTGLLLYTQHLKKFEYIFHLLSNEAFFYGSFHLACLIQYIISRAV